MQAGREWEPGELDVLVAETLGWVFSERHETWSHNATYKGELPKFSTTWDGMGVLVEEAREQGIYLDVLPQEKTYICEAKNIMNDTIGSVTHIEAPYAACLVYLSAKGIAI